MRLVISEPIIDRQKIANKMWEGVNNIDGFAKFYILFEPSYRLYDEAVWCYRGGQFMASTLMCRSTVETALYRIASRKILKYNASTILRLNVDFDLVEAKWGCVLCRAKAMGIVDKKLEKRFIDIRELGNFVAHYGQKVDRESITLRSTLKTLKLGIIEKEARRKIWTTLHILKRLNKEAERIGITIEAS